MAPNPRQYGDAAVFEIGFVDHDQSVFCCAQKRCEHRLHRELKPFVVAKRFDACAREFGIEPVHRERRLDDEHLVPSFDVRVGNQVQGFVGTVCQ